MSDNIPAQVPAAGNAVSAGTQGQGDKLWRLIATVAAVIAALMIIAVLALQITEFRFYSQPPSAWPSISGSK